MNPPCHSERSEESRVQCGDVHPHPWPHRFAYLPQSTSTNASTVCSGDHKKIRDSSLRSE